MTRAVSGSAQLHLVELSRVLEESADLVDRTSRWAATLAQTFRRGNMLLAGGNGGSAAEAQHLTAELVGRFRSERRGLPALALHGDTSTLTAVGNDYGYDQVLARSVEAFARPRDVVLLLTTSGRSPNLLEAAVAGRRAGASVWAMTGRAPNPLTELADDVLAIDSDDTCVVQEMHLVAVHLVAEAVDQAMQIRAVPGLARERVDVVTA